MRDIFGPYLACLVLALVFAWPLAVFPGIAGVAAEVLWVPAAAGVLLAARRRRRRPMPPRAPRLPRLHR